MDRAKPPRDRSNRLAFGFVLLVGCAYLVALILKVDGLNGPYYWPRGWKSLPLLPTTAWLALPMLPFAAALYLIERRPTQRALLPLALLVLANVGLQLGALLAHGDGLARLAAIVASPLATSYYNDATVIQGPLGWLAHFHQAQLGLHSSTHPPGPILYYYAWLQSVGAERAAAYGGLGIALLAASCIPMLHAFTGLWTGDRRARLLCCAWYALLPATIVFLPEFDQVYPLFSMALALAWVRALDGSSRAAIAFGAALATAVFFAWNLLALGAFVASYALYWLWQTRASAAAWRRLLGTGLMAALTIAAIYLLFGWCTGYDPLRSFQHAIQIQALQAVPLGRRWLDCALYDPFDFLLGAGMLAAPLLILFALRVRSLGPREKALSLSALAAILVIDLSGLLRAETARVWIFLLPFAIVPAALELMRFDARRRALLFALHWGILLTLVVRLSFIDP
ncbi:MAG TPA: hypothetical protein VGC55_14895 [Dokdonella sp.]